MTDTTTPTQAEIEDDIARDATPEEETMIAHIMRLQAENAILRTEKHADAEAEAIGALQAERDEHRAMLLGVSSERDSAAKARDEALGAHRQEIGRRMAAEAELTAANQRAAASLEAVVKANAERDELLAWKRYWGGEMDAILAGREEESDRADKAETERDALVAAAYEAAAQSIKGETLIVPPEGVGMRDATDSIRNQCVYIVSQCTSPHATAALDRIKAEARADGLREAASVGYIECAKTRHVTLGQAVEAAILALIPTSSTCEAKLAENPPKTDLLRNDLAQTEPAQVTVQEAANVLLDWAEHNTFGYGGDFADAIGAAGITTLRAIAGGRNE